MIKTATISVKYFSVLAEITGKRSEEISIENGATAAEILNELTVKYPQMERFVPYVRAAVNKSYVKMETALDDGDELTFITPVSGG